MMTVVKNQKALHSYPSTFAPRVIDRRKSHSMVEPLSHGNGAAPRARRSNIQHISAFPGFKPRKQTVRSGIKSWYPAIAFQLQPFDFTLLAGLALALLMIVPMVRHASNNPLFQGASLQPLTLPSDEVGFNLDGQILNESSQTLTVDFQAFQEMTMATHVVQKDETISGIALEYGLTYDTLISVNDIDDVRRLQVGTVLNIPSADGLWYTTKSGDSLASIAQDYGVSVNELLDKNNLDSTSIPVGLSLFIPGASMDPVDLKLALGELFAWPTVGRFTSDYGYRADPFTGQRRFHNGIDLANSQGTAIRAAASGRVVHVETQTGNYGKYMIIDHGRGFKTLYAHLYDFNARVGDYVDMREVIGYMGTTGRSTGNHLHFSVIRNGNFVDPMDYLE